MVPSVTLTLMNLVEPYLLNKSVAPLVDAPEHSILVVLNVVVFANVSAEKLNSDIYGLS